MKNLIVITITLLSLFFNHSISAQFLTIRDLIHIFEKDTSITLSKSNVIIESSNYYVDNLLVEAIVFRPNRDGNFPGLILVPGYMRTAKHFIYLGLNFAKEGFASIAITQPGYGRSEGKPDWVGPRTINSLIKGYDRFKKEIYVDSTKIGLLGYSRGALAVSLMSVKLSDVKAAIFVSGCYDFQKAYDSAKIQGIKKNMEIETGMSANAIKERSSIIMMQNLNCPVLILHGKNDKNVSVNQAYLLRDKLIELGKEFEIQIFPDKEHNIGRENLLKYSIEFFKHQLL